MRSLARILWRLRHDSEGATAAEFGLLLPVCFVVLFGLMDLGRLGFVMASLDHAAQEGAQFASRRPADSDTTPIVAHVRSRLHVANPGEVDVRVAWSPAGATDRLVTVSADCRFTFALGLVPVPDIRLRTSSSMTVL